MSNPSNTDRLKTLTRKEATVLYWKCRGWTYKSIGEELGYGEDRVTQLMSIVYRKLGFSNSMHWTVRTRLLSQVLCGEFRALIGNEYGNLEEWPLYGVPLAGEIVQVGKEAPKETAERASSKPPEERVPDPEMMALVIYDEKQLAAKPQVVQGQIIRLEPPKIQEPETNRDDGRDPWTKILVGLGVLVVIAGVGGAAYYFGTRQAQRQAPPTLAISFPTVGPADTPVPPTSPEVSTPVPQVIVVTATFPSPTEAPTLLPTPAISLPFTDNFDNGADPKWRVLSGNWITVDGRYTVLQQDGQSGWYLSMLDDPTWSNYRVSVNVQIPNGYSAGQGHVVLVVRTLNTQTKYLGFRIGDSMKGGWALIAGASYDEQPIAGYGRGVPDSASYELEVNGDSFTARVNGQTFQQITLTGYRQGGVGLGIQCVNQCPSFDDFRVEALGP